MPLVSHLSMFLRHISSIHCAEEEGRKENETIFWDVTIGARACVCKCMLNAKNIKLEKII